MDPFNMIPDLAATLGIPQGTLLFLMFALVIVSRAVTRAIPDDATGFAGFVRQLTAIIAVEVSSRVSSGVTVKDVAKAALTTPPISAKVAAETGEDVTATPAPLTEKI